MSKRIELTQGKFTIVDDADYNRLNRYKWCAGKREGNYGYAVRSIRIRGKSPIMIMMHREILGLKKGDGKHVDHIDHDGLNNQRNNIRICTQQQNSFNQNSHSDALSSYVGVSRYQKSKKWVVRFWLNGKNVYLGSYDDEIEAAKVHDRAALKYRGKFAKLNFLIVNSHNNPTSIEAKREHPSGGASSFNLKGGEIDDRI